MRLTKVDKDGYWWAGTKTDWAIEDSKGNWWIYRYKKPTMKTRVSPKKKACASSRFDVRDYIIIALLSSVLGIGLAFVVALASNML